MTEMPFSAEGRGANFRISYFVCRLQGVNEGRLAWCGVVVWHGTAWRGA